MAKTTMFVALVVLVIGGCGQVLSSENLNKNVSSEYLGQNVSSEYLGQNVSSEDLGQNVSSEDLGSMVSSQGLGVTSKVASSEVLGHVVRSSTVRSSTVMDYPSNIRANSGEELTIICGVQEDTTSQSDTTEERSSALGADGEMTNCQWSKDGFGLGAEPQASGWPRYSLVDCNLRIYPVLPKDEGSFRCQITTVVNNQNQPFNQNLPHNQSKRCNQSQTDSQAQNQTHSHIPNQSQNQTQPDSQTEAYNATMFLTVNAEPGPPWIEEAKVQDVLSLEEGEELQLHCQSLGGKPAAQIQWNHQESETEFPDVWTSVSRMSDLKTFKTVSRLKLKATQDMTVTCSASNDLFPHPRTSRALHIKIKRPPQIHLEFSSSNIKQGQFLEVRCVTSLNTETANYTWYVNGTQVKGQTGDSLIIGEVSQEYDKAKVKCVVENLDGITEVSQDIKLEKTPTIVISPEDKLANEGDTVELSCQADYSGQGDYSGQPKYIWFKGKSLQLVGVDQNLTIIAKAESEGDYVCHALLGHHTLKSNPAKLRIKRKPKILGETPKLGMLNRDAILECVVESPTETRILWVKNNQPIQDGGDKYRVVVSENGRHYRSYLVIFNLQGTDFAKYGCFASNQVGTDYRLISLKQETKKDFLTILICSNVFLIIAICLGCLCYRHAKDRREREEIEINEQNATLENTGATIFVELLPRKYEENKDSLEIRQNIKNLNLDSERGMITYRR